MTVSYEDRVRMGRAWWVLVAAVRRAGGLVLDTGDGYTVALGGDA